MFKSRGLLKVVSILLIIFGALGILVVGFAALMVNAIKDMPGITDTLLAQTEAAFTPLNLVLVFAAGILCVLAGILGIMGKSFTAALVVIIIYIVYQVAELILNIIGGLGFSVTNIIPFILPVLYVWGLYQCKEN